MHALPAVQQSTSLPQICSYGLRAPRVLVFGSPTCFASLFPLLGHPAVTILQAFSKVTHQEPEHGEAWANLSALWLQEGGWREALHAAEQAVKLKRDSWQTWDNYALAAAQAQAPTSCVRGLAEVRLLAAAACCTAVASLRILQSLHLLQLSTHLEQTITLSTGAFERMRCY